MQGPHPRETVLPRPNLGHMPTVTFKDLTGQTFNRLTVIDRAPNRAGKTRWNCLCACGSSYVASGQGLRSGSPKSCGCLSREYSQKVHDDYLAAHPGAPNGGFSDAYHGYRQWAKKRGHAFEISRECVLKLFGADCVYCGSPPSNEVRKGTLGAYRYNGIDRLDNAAGYVDGNVVTCCKTCNWAKQKMELDDFFAWVKRVAERIPE